MKDEGGRMRKDPKLHLPDAISSRKWAMRDHESHALRAVPLSSSFILQPSSLSEFRRIVSHRPKKALAFATPPAARWRVKEREKA